MLLATPPGFRDWWWEEERPAAANLDGDFTIAGRLALASARLSIRLVDRMAIQKSLGEDVANLIQTQVVCDARRDCAFAVQLCGAS